MPYQILFTKAIKAIMLFAAIAIIVGFVLLVWSADRFVEGAASIASYFGMPPLLIGMVIVGFGTSAPEMLVSALAAFQGNPGIALGNAYGSNIVNMGLILGITALIRPIRVQSQVLRKELPILIAVTALSACLFWDGDVSQRDAIILLLLFVLLMGWTIWQGLKKGQDPLANELEQEIKSHQLPVQKAVFWLLAGLVLLVGSSRILVWGAVAIAHGFGISDLVIGLTIVAIGTSLPELAASVSAIKKGEDDIALGNVLGSNLFNLLAVVGIAGIISPMEVGEEVLKRDLAAVMALTVFLWLASYSFKGKRQIGRLSALVLLAGYAGHSAYLAYGLFGS